MKKILAITLITLGVVIAGGYSTTVYAEPTQAYETTDTLPLKTTTKAWGENKNTLYQAECSGPWVATMTHTFDGRECMIIDIDDTHLEWSGRMQPGADYMIKWTNIYATAIGSGTYWLKIDVSGADHLKGKKYPDATLTTSYAIKTPGLDGPVRGDFKLAKENFNGDLPGSPVAGVDGKRVSYDQDLWARVVIDADDPLDVYEDEFLLTFSISNTP